MRGYLVGLILVCGSGCIWTPASRSNQESTGPTPVSGYASVANTEIVLQARNYDTGAFEVVGRVSSASHEQFASSGLFPWSLTLPAQPKKYWAPSNLGVATHTLGRLEIRGFQGDSQLLTFTEPARQCASEKMANGESQANAGVQCSDGQELVLFDNSGYGVAGEALSWTVVGSKVIEGVSVKIVKYQSDGFEVYGLVCAPQGAGPYALAVYNHGGGYGSTTDEAQGCLNWAKHGWVLALSSYRGEHLLLPAGWGLATDLLSQGKVETSLGEVKDVLRLLDITRQQTNVNKSRVLMYGVSHGASITTRAVQSGAAVQVAASIMPSNDWAQTFNDCLGSSDWVCKTLLLNQGDGATPPSQSPLAKMFGGTPSMNPTSYAWRSPLSFASDLTVRKDVKFLMQHGIADTSVRATQSCKLAEQAWGSNVNAFRVPSSGAADAWSTVPVTGCPQSWTAGKRPAASWPDDRYLLLYDGMGHAPAGAMVKDWVSFVNSLAWGAPF